MRRHVIATPTVGISTLLHLPLMSNQPAPEIELLRAAYAAFNARDLDAALALMTPDVHWPRAFKGGFVRGPEEVRAYWTEQWSEIDGHVEPVAFHLEAAGQVLVEVHQIVRDLAGAVLADEHVGHRFTIEHGLIQAMEVCPLLSSGLGA
ncbi:MAG: nuclear transport factor 2 family protein [Phormidesmis sp.]